MDVTPEPARSQPYKVFAKNIAQITLLLNAPLQEAQAISAKIDAAPKDYFVPSAVAELQTLLDEMRSSLAIRKIIMTWAIPMLVTFTEAYLQDALGLIVSGAFQASKLPGPIVDEIGAKWIKNAIRSGNPHQWINQLKNFGATGYPDDLADRMKKTWDLRHDITHSAEPDISGMKNFPLSASLQAAADFVHATEDFVMANAGFNVPPTSP